jgi:hypothetical protein
MRILKVLGFLVVVVLAVLLILHVLGWKCQKPPAPPEVVTLVGDDDTATPALKVGEILKWVGTGKDAFTIQFLYGGSPCALSKYDSSPDASGVQVVTCPVTNVSPSVTFYYGILSGDQIRRQKLMDGLHQCPGCFYGADPTSKMFTVHPVSDIPHPLHQMLADSDNHVIVSCDEISGHAGTYQISLQPDPVGPDSATNDIVVWKATGGLQAFSISFLDSASQCGPLTQANASCGFSESGTYSYQYKLTANQGLCANQTQSGIVKNPLTH